jgi:CHAT domain-containing protein/tetratricopeptide (TPR) repeat protein
MVVCASAQRPRPAPKPSPEVQKLLDVAEKLPAKVRSPKLEEALDSAIRLKDRVGEARARNFRGECWYELSQAKQALEEYEAAIPIEREVGDRASEATTLGNIGAAWDDLGQKQKALDYYARALSIQREIGDRGGEATSLGNIGFVYWSLGQQQKALTYFSRVLLIDREVGDRGGVALTLTNIGAAYNSLGQKQKALEFFEQALPILREVGDRGVEAATLSNIGAVYNTLNQQRKALDYLRQALPIRREVGDRLGEASTLNNIGRAYYGVFEQHKALDYYEQALAIEQDVGDHYDEARTLSSLGSVYYDLGQPQKMLDYYARAIPIAREVGDREQEAGTLGVIGGVLRSIGLSRLAALQLKQSVAAVQSLGGEVARMGPGARRTYAEQSGATYLALAICLASDGRAAEVEQFLALSKTDAGPKATGDTPFTDFEARWRAQFEMRTAAIADLGRRISELRVAKTLTPAQADELKKLVTAKDAAQTEFRGSFDRAIEESKHVDQAKNIVTKTIASTSIEAALAKLPLGTAIVYALPDKDTVHLIVERLDHRDIFTAHAMGLESTVTAFRQVLQRPDLDPRPLGKELYDVLFKPIEKMLDPHAVAAWFLAGSLRTIPVGALYDGKSYVIETHQSALFSPAFVPELAKPPSHRSGAIVAGVTVKSSPPDPINGVPVSFPKLDSVREETNAAAKTVGTKPMLDGDFTTKTLVSSLKKHPGVIHLASHFRYVPGDDRRSFLLTGGNGAWTVDSIKSLPDNALRGVDLVTLSACATGEGESATGEEAESFAAWMQRKGAGAVLSTLWPIADRSTALLFSEFYRLRQAHPNWTKIEALRQAQLEMLRGAIGRQASSTALKTRSDLGKRSASKLKAPPWPANLPKYAHPYYWAPFVLTGNWQ